MSSIAQINANLKVLGFKNTSLTSIVEEIAIAVGQFDDVLLAEIQNSESIITNLLISNQGYGKPEYYTAIALAFQYGDNLAINENINPVTGEPYLNLIYDPIDTTKKIITQAAFQESVGGGSNFLKVATSAVSGGGLAPLSSDQLTAFQSYMLNFEIVGIPLDIISIAGNVLNFTTQVTYLSSFDLPTLQANVVAALNTFLTNFKINGEFYTNDLTSYITTNVPGVRSCFINNTTLDGVAFTDYTSLSSGYFNYSDSVYSNLAYNPVTS